MCNGVIVRMDEIGRRPEPVVTRRYGPLIPPTAVLEPHPCRKNADMLGHNCDCVPR